MKVKFKLLRTDSCLPVYATDGAAACDFIYSGEAVTLAPGAHAMIGTGLAVQIDRGFALHLLPRSGLGAKHGVILRNSLGLIDSDYRGEVMVCLYNSGTSPFTLNNGDRFAQGEFVPVVVPVFEVVDELDQSDRGTGGFGSTGQNSTPARTAPRPYRSTHTLVSMGVTPETYNEIKNKLREAGYSHTFLEDGVDMTGIMLTPM